MDKLRDEKMCKYSCIVGYDDVQCLVPEEGVSKLMRSACKFVLACSVSPAGIRKFRVTSLSRKSQILQEMFKVLHSANIIKVTKLNSIICAGHRVLMKFV
jgi:hypothetical protein